MVDKGFSFNGLPICITKKKQKMWSNKFLTYSNIFIIIIINVPLPQKVFLGVFPSFKPLVIKPAEILTFFFGDFYYKNCLTVSIIVAPKALKLQCFNLLRRGVQICRRHISGEITRVVLLIWVPVTSEGYLNYWPGS